MTLRAYPDHAIDRSENPYNVRLPSIKEMYDGWQDESTSAHPPRPAFYGHDHAPEPSDLDLATIEQQELFDDEDCGTESTAGLSHKLPTNELASASSCHGPQMVLLPPPNTLQVPPIANKSAPAHRYSSTTTVLIGAGRLEDQIDPSPYRSQYESVMQTSVERTIPRQRIKGKSSDRSQNLQAADKKAQAEKHRKSEQERRKGASYEICNMEWHIPMEFLDQITSRSTKLRHTNDVSVSISRPSKNGVLGKGNILIEALEDELTITYKHKQELRQTIAAKDKLIQELLQRLEAPDAFNAAPAAQYPTPPDSPKLNKSRKSDDSLEGGGNFETPSRPSKCLRYAIYDADAKWTDWKEDSQEEWTDWEEGWQDRRLKPHEGRAWKFNVLARMESIQRRQLRRSSDVSPARVERMSTPTSIDVEGHLSTSTGDPPSVLFVTGRGCTPPDSPPQALTQYQ